MARAKDAYETYTLIALRKGAQHLAFSFQIHTKSQWLAPIQHLEARFKLDKARNPRDIGGDKRF